MALRLRTRMQTASAGYTGAMPAAASSGPDFDETRGALPSEGFAAGGTGREIDQGALSHVFGYCLSLADIPSKRVFAHFIGKPMDLRPVEFTTLLLVTFNPGVTQKQLAQVLAMSAPNMTILIDRMTERGLLARVRSETDRRAQNVHATADGEALAHRAHAVSKTMEAELLSPLSPGERILLFELLQKIARQRRG